MVCTYCHFDTQVLNSRLQKRTNSVWRRRTCKNCSSVFTTTEQVDYEKSWVVQYHDGLSVTTAGNTRSRQSQPFQRDKLFICIYKSLQHRQTADTDAIGLTATIMGQLQQIAQHGRLTATVIATLSQQALQRFDPLAATLYAAYHADVL